MDLNCDCVSFDELSAVCTRRLRRLFQLLNVLQAKLDKFRWFQWWTVKSKKNSAVSGMEIGRRRKWNVLAIRNLKICLRRERSYLRDLVIEVRKKVSCVVLMKLIFPHVHPRIRAVTIRIGPWRGSGESCLSSYNKRQTIYCSTCQKRRRIFY